MFWHICIWFLEICIVSPVLNAKPAIRKRETWGPGSWGLCTLCAFAGERCSTWETLPTGCRSSRYPRLCHRGCVHLLPAWDDTPVFDLLLLYWWLRLHPRTQMGNSAWLLAANAGTCFRSRYGFTQWLLHSQRGCSTLFSLCPVKYLMEHCSAKEKRKLKNKEINIVQKPASRT